MPPVAPPTVYTPRLILREWRPADLDAFAAIHADPDVRRFVGNGRPLSRLEAEEEINGFLSEWNRLGHGRWAVEERASGELVGSCGLLSWQEGTPGACPEVAYGFAQSRWGKGIATEAARSSIAWALQALTFERVVGLTHPDNVASQHVLEKCGMTYAGEAQGRHGLLRLYAADRSSVVLR